MATQTPLLRSFNAGEWSPLMAGRIDLDKYGASCRVMQNFLPTPQGGAVARSGTAYVVDAYNYNSQSALLPFQFSTLQSCILEFGDHILRFITNDGLLLAPGGGIYSVATPYDAADTPNIRYAQKNDVLYLFCANYPVYKLERLGSTDWRINQVSFTDGPWLETNYESNHASFTGTGGTPLRNYWTGMNNNQTGTITWNTDNLTTMTGYQITLPANNSYTFSGSIYNKKDMEPVSWTLLGSVDNQNWVTIDSQSNFVDYVNDSSDWIQVYPSQAFQYYRINITAVYTDSSIPPNVNSILVASKEDQPINITFDNLTNINFGEGFLQTDVGRLIRIQRSDGTWIPFKILGVNGTNSVTAQAQHMPLLDTTITTYWRLGLYCATNGFPSCGVFYSERLWMGGVAQYPDTVVGSQVGSYENMQPDDPRGGDISDSDAINVTLESRSQILWMNSDDRGLVMGTSAGEWTIQSGAYTNYTTASAISPKSILARSPTQRGSADVDAVRIDHQILYVQRSGRQVRAMSYSFEIDGYNSISLSTQASHLGQPSIVRMAYQAEPYSNVWAIREDGVLLSLTYMQDQQVVGWAKHDVGGAVESIACIPAPDSQQDTLWMVVRRQINGRTVRYVERLLRSWDFDMTEQQAVFVDCCTADNSGNQTISVPHLAGEQVYGLIDGNTPFGPISCDPNTANIVLPQKPNSFVVVGLGMTSTLVTQRIEAGSQLGTAQGKTKRIARASMRLWNSGAGKVGVPPSTNNPDGSVEPIIFDNAHGMEWEDGPLHSFDYSFYMPAGYDTNGCVKIVRDPEDLFPLNVLSLTLWVTTEDAP